MVKIIIVSLFFILNCNSGDNDISSIMTHVKSVDLQLDDDFPLYRVNSMAISDTTIAVVDATMPRLTTFDRAGNPYFSVGQSGSGPGDLLNPTWVGFDGRGHIAVIESPGNDRVQFFSQEDGEPLQFITQNILFPGRHAYFETATDRLQIVMSTRAACTDDEGYQCVVQRQNVDSQEVVDRFARPEEISPGATGLPWIMGVGESGNLYLAHNFASGFITSYSPQGEKLNRFRMDSSPTIYPIDWDEMPERMMEQMELYQQGLQRSDVWALHVMKDDVIVEHQSRGSEESDVRYLSVFGKDGIFKTTVEVDYRGYVVEDDRIFFVEDVDPEAEFGAFTIHEYRYDGVAE